MQHTFNFPLKCANAIKEFALSYTKEAVTDNVYIFDINSMEISILELLNLELETLGLPKARGIVIFKRKNCRISPGVHIDCGQDSEPIHASIIIPVEGYHDTFMYWMDGQYEKKLTSTDTGVSYQKIFWIGIPKLINHTQILDTTLCRVDVPHSASSKLDGSYRTIVSIRLQGNPTVEEILAKTNQA